MKKYNFIGTFAALAAVGAIFGSAATASAWSVRQSGAGCDRVIGTSDTLYYDGAGLANTSLTGSASAACPVPDNSSMPKTAITSLSVVVYDASATQSVSVRACVSYAGTIGGSCGAAASTSTTGTGLSTLSPSRTLWTSYPTGMPYVNVALPAQTSSTSAPSRYQGSYFSG
jgi:hypothetical protein